MFRSIAMTLALGVAVCACGQQRTAIDPKLDSGVTESNGGGTRALGNNPNIGIGGTGGAARPPSSNSQGPAY